MEAIRNYVEALFAANLEDKFNALLDEGKNEAEATGLVIASIGSAQELRSELDLDTESAEIPSESASKTVDPALAEEYRQYQERKHVLIAVAVALFILAPFVQNLFSSILSIDAIGTFLFFVMVAAGVVICILATRRNAYYRELFGLSREDDAAR